MHQFYYLFSFFIPFVFFFIFFAVIITFVSSLKSINKNNKNFSNKNIMNKATSFKGDHNQTHLQQQMYQHAYSKKKKDSFTSQEAVGGIKDKPLSEAEKNVLYGK